ncbi:MAG: LytTR family DNA-binding domain-containing protein [Bacteroidota bacterium]
MRTLLIEDEPSARNTLTTMLKTYCPEVEMAGTASCIDQGLQLIKAFDPQLLFLDVQLPDGEGFDLLRKLSKINFQVIFVTAHESYALKAIKFSALDYLVKPIDPDDLVSAVNKAMAEPVGHATSKRIHTLFDNTRDNRGLSKLVLKDHYGMQVVSIDEIIHIEANGSYSDFFLECGDKLCVSKSIGDYQRILSNHQFFRSHKSHLINLNQLLRYDRREGDQLIMKDGSYVPLAIRKKEQLLKLLEAVH